MFDKKEKKMKKKMKKKYSFGILELCFSKYASVQSSQSQSRQSQSRQSQSRQKNVLKAVGRKQSTAHK